MSLMSYFNPLGMIDYPKNIEFYDPCDYEIDTNPIATGWSDYTTYRSHDVGTPLSYNGTSLYSVVDIATGQARYCNGCLSYNIEALPKVQIEYEGLDYCTADAYANSQYSMLSVLLSNDTEPQENTTDLGFSVVNSAKGTGNQAGIRQNSTWISDSVVSKARNTRYKAKIIYDFLINQVQYKVWVFNTQEPSVWQTITNDKIVFSTYLKILNIGYIYKSSAFGNGTSGYNIYWIRITNQNV